MNRRKKHLIQWSSRIAILGSIAMLACSCTHKQSEDDVPVIGLGTGGESVIRYLPRITLFKHVAPMLSKTVDLTTGKLEKYETNPNFKLSRVTVGIELDPGIGINAGIVQATVGLEAQIELRMERLPLPSEPIKIGF